MARMTIAGGDPVRIDHELDDLFPRPRSGLFPRVRSGPYPLPAYASWTSRVLAAVFDNAILGTVTFLSFAVQPVVAPQAVPLMGSAPDDLVPGVSWFHSGWVVLTVLVLLLMQAYLGSTPGKLAVGIAVVREVDGRPAGLWRTVARWFVHLVDAILCLGYLRAAWHPRGLTLADSALGTVAVVADGRRDDPRLARPWAWRAAAWVLVVLALPFQLMSSGGSRSEQVTAMCSAPAVSGEGPALRGGTATWSAESRWTRRLFLTRPGADRIHLTEVVWRPVGGTALDGTASYQVRLGEPGDTSWPIVSVDVTDGEVSGYSSGDSFDVTPTEVRAMLPGGEGVVLDPDAVLSLTVERDGVVSPACIGTVTSSAP
jgi:Mce-associated membrane protein